MNALIIIISLDTIAIIIMLISIKQVLERIAKAMEKGPNDRP